jgi:hypothetical protein
MDQKTDDRSASEKASARSLKVGGVVLLAALIVGGIMTAVGMRHLGPVTTPSVAQSNDPALRTPIETRGEGSPQEPTGPFDTKPDGVPAASPQGETPPGMPSAPRGSS